MIKLATIMRLAYCSSVPIKVPPERTLRDLSHSNHKAMYHHHGCYMLTTKASLSGTNTLRKMVLSISQQYSSTVLLYNPHSAVHAWVQTFLTKEHKQCRPQSCANKLCQGTFKL
jgi:hypothetical protein